MIAFPNIPNPASSVIEFFATTSMSYVLIFIFSALWFGHFCLRALTRLRAEAPPARMVEASVIEVTTIELPRE